MSVQENAVVSKSNSGSWWGVVLVIGVLALFGAVTAAITWSAASARVSRVDQLIPLSNGVTLTYRVKSGDKVHYRSRNIERMEGGSAFGELDTTSAMLIFEALGPDVGTNPDKAREELVRTPIIRISDTDYAPGENPAHWSGLFLLKPGSLVLTAATDRGYQTALPFVDLSVPDGTVTETHGLLATGEKFTSTLTLETRESVDTPIGQLRNCARVRRDITVTNVLTRTVTWYCADIGAAREEQTVNGRMVEQSELIGVSVPDIVRVVEPLPVTGLGAAARPSGQTKIAPPLQLAWKFNEPVEDQGLSTVPVVAGDLLYYGTYGGSLIALDRGRHLIQWRFQTGNTIYSTPIISNGIVYFGSADRRIYALDAATGALIWAFGTDDVISAGLVVSGGTVYAASEDRRVYALDARTGKLRWQYTTGGLISHAPAVGAGAVYVGSDDGAVYALDQGTGALRWAWNAGTSISTSPVFVNGIVYVGAYDEHVYALKADTANEQGEVVWDSYFGTRIASSITLVGGTLYVVAEGDVRALDAASGLSKWYYHNSASLRGGALLFGDLLYVMGGDKIIALDALRGAELAATPTDPTTVPAGLGTDGVNILVAHSGGLLEAFGSKP